MGEERRFACERHQAITQLVARVRSAMRPLLLKGHTRPLTFIKYNLEGDVFVSCAKDQRPTLWYADSGERIGTYKGHNGTTYSCDITRDSSRLVTASADSSVKLWNLVTGECIFTFEFKEPCRSVSFSLGEEYLLLTSDAFMGVQPAVRILKHSKDISEQTHEEVLCIKGAHPGRITRAIWGKLNKTFLTSCEDGMVRKFETATGKLLHEVKIHEKSIQMMDIDKEGNTLVTASLDSCRLSIEGPRCDWRWSGCRLCDDHGRTGW